MEQNQYVEYLLHFGLTRQEALIYVELLVKGKQMDIGFEDLAREIYYSKDAVEIPEQYCKALELVVKNSRLIAAVKRAVINQLNVIQPS